MSRWQYFDPEREPRLKGLDYTLIDLLDKAREIAGIPFIITSGIRSEEANRMVGGVPNSAHVLGLAADLRCGSAYECFKIVNALLKVGAMRIVIGIRTEAHQVVYHNIHVDVDLNKPAPILAVKRY